MITLRCCCSPRSDPSPHGNYIASCIFVPSLHGDYIASCVFVCNRKQRPTLHFLVMWYRDQRWTFLLFIPDNLFFPLRIQLSERKGVRTGLTGTVGEGNKEANRKWHFSVAKWRKYRYSAKNGHSYRFLSSIWGNKQNLTHKFIYTYTVTRMKKKF